MFKIIVIMYFVIMIVLVIAYCVNHVTIKRFEMSFNSVGDYQEVFEKIINYRNQIVKDEIKIKKGTVYYYDSNNNFISVVEKGQYTEYDLFVFSHEIGHSIECFIHSIIYKIISAVNVFTLLLFVISMIVNIVFVVKNQNINTFLIMLNVITGFLFAVKLGFLYWIEKNASIQAVKIMNQFKKLSDGYDKIINLSIVNQYVFNSMLFLMYMMTFTAIMKS